MDMAYIIISLGLLIVFSHVFSALFVRIRVPSVLLLMIIGLLAGPVFQLVQPEDVGKAGSVFTTVTLICILFESGTGLSLKTIGASIGKASLLTVLNFIGMLAICAPVGHYILDLDWIHSFFLGAALGGTSSAIIIPMLEQLRPGGRTRMALLLESTFSDVLCLAVALALMSGIESGHIDMKDAAVGTLQSVIFAVAAGAVAGTAWLLILKSRLQHMKHSIFTSFALAFIIYGICELVGWNGGLCVLSYGVALGNIGHASFVRKWITTEENLGINKEERDFFGEVVFVLQTYFFVYIGICIQLKNPWHLAVGAIVVALAFCCRHFVAGLVGGPALAPRDRRLLAALGAKGLVAAVLATVPLQSTADYIRDNGLDAEAVENAAELKMNDEMPFRTVAADYYAPVQATISAGSTIPGSDYRNFAEAVDLVYAGKTVRNVAYAVVLLSIILCAVLVILGERQPADQPEPSSEPETVPEAEA